MSGNVIEVRVIPQPRGFVVADSIVAPLYFIFSDPSGMSGGPFEHQPSLVRRESPSAASTENTSREALLGNYKRDT